MTTQIHKCHPRDTEEQLYDVPLHDVELNDVANGRDFLISGHFLFLFNTSMCDNDSVPIESPPFSDIHSIDMILIRSSQCSWRTEDEMKHSAIPVGLGKQNSCLNYANVTAFLLNRSDSKSPTKLSSRKWHLRLDWQ